VRLRGHAIEARLYAEDPESGFLPAAGRIEALRWPAGVRVDSGVREGDPVSDRYDPMLAKLIATGHNRSEAVAALRAALGETLVLGVRTNLRFLRWLVDTPELRDGEMRTDSIARMDLPGPPTVPDAAWRAAARALVPGPSRDPWGGGWRLNIAPTMRLVSDETERAVELEDAPADGTPAIVVADGVAHVDVEGRSVEIGLAPPPTVEEAVRHAVATGGGPSVLVAPMPGRVIGVRASQGDRVAAHQPIVVIEAMKMEHAVLAPSDGILVRIAVRDGQQVQRGDRLAEVAPA
jgi:acetyl/propionyl-CoA carboxylase alpha subunit